MLLLSYISQLSNRVIMEFLYGAPFRFINAYQDSDEIAPWFSNEIEKHLSPEIWSTAPVAYYRLGRANVNGDGAFNLRDYSGNGHTLRLHSDTDFGDFDGVDDYIAMSDHADFELSSNDVTITCWFMHRGSGVNTTFCAKWNSTGDQREYILRLTSGDEVSFISSSNGTAGGNLSTTTTTGGLAAFVWNHLAVVKSGTNVDFYINGAVVTDNGTANNSSVFGGTQAFEIGRATSTDYFDGAISEFRVYNGTALTAAQIVDGYKNDNWPTTNLNGYWKLDETNMPTDNAADSSGNSHTGTVFGAASKSGAIQYSPVFTDGGFNNAGTNHGAITIDTFNPTGDTGQSLSVMGTINSAALANAVIANQYDNTANIGAWRIACGGVGNTNKLRVFIYSDGTGATYKDYLSSVDAIDSTRHTFGFSWDNGTLKLYIDGVEDTSVTKTNDDVFTAMSSFTTPITIGTNINDGIPIVLPIQGVINDLAVYNIVQPASTFLAFHNK